MMKCYYLALVVSIFAFFLLAIEASPTREGFKLDKRVRKTMKLSDVGNFLLSDREANLRQWNEDEYELIMSSLSGQGNLRHRLMQQNDNYQSGEYYLPEQRRLKNWQIIALMISVTGSLFFAYYAYTLRNELSTLNQYLPLGYKLFPDHDASEDERPIDGVEIS